MKIWMCPTRILVTGEESLKTKDEQRKIIAELENEKKKLLCIVSHLQSEVTLLNSKLNNMTYSLRRLNDRDDMMKEAEDTGFNHSFYNQQSKRIGERLFPSEKKRMINMSNHMLQHPGRFNETPTNFKFSTWRCHYYGDFSHIKPFYFKFYGDKKSSVCSKANKMS